MTKTIIARRDKVVAAWLNQVCPVVDAELSADGTLTFENAAVTVNVTAAPEQYEVAWCRFDNTTDQRIPVGEPLELSSGSARAPDGLMTSDFVAASVTALHPRHRGWTTPSTFFFRRGKAGTASENWSLVGVERGASQGLKLRAADGTDSAGTGH
jgi:hypothetical protein